MMIGEYHFASMTLSCDAVTENEQGLIEKTMSDRRQFLKMLSTTMLAPILWAEAREGVKAQVESKPSQIPLAFSTLGCPAWEWKKILDFATQHGFSAIELRGLEGKLDLPTLPFFAA